VKLSNIIESTETVVCIQTLPASWKGAIFSSSVSSFIAVCLALQYKIQCRLVQELSLEGDDRWPDPVFV